MFTPRQPADARPGTAQIRVRQLVSPGTVTAVLGALGEFLAWSAWIAWLLLGFARGRPQPGDVVDNRGTWRWGMGVLLASVLAALVVAVVPAAAIPGSRGVILIAGAAVALSGVALRQWSIVTLGRFSPNG